MPRKPAKKKTQRRERWELVRQDPDWWAQLFESIGRGANLTELILLQDLQYTAVHRMIMRDEELSKRYDEARASRALVHAGRIEALVDDVEAGKTPADAGRVVLQGRQWLASRMDPKHWGEQIKVQQDIKVQDVTDKHLDAVRAMMQ